MDEPVETTQADDTLLTTQQTSLFGTRAKRAKRKFREGDVSVEESSDGSEDDDDE